MRRWFGVAAVAMVGLVPVVARAQSTTGTTSGAVAPIAFGTPTVADMALLKKAVDAVQKNPVLVKSDVHAKASSNGAILTINESIKVVGKFPGTFNSDVVIWDEDGKTAAAKFQVVGDGTNVYTYQPAVKQYSVQTVEAFQKDLAMPAIGIVCGLVASGQQWTGDEPPADATAVASFLDMLKQAAGITLVSGPGTNGQRVFEMRIGAENPTVIRLTAEPASQSFVEVEMHLTMDKWKIDLTEKVQSQAKLTSLDNVAFTPPAGATKVAKLAVWPF